MSEAAPYREGYWMVRVVRGGPLVCARIWLCSHEPGVPENVMDRPHWQGQLGLDLTPPGKIWSMLEFCEASPEQQRLLADPPEIGRAPRHGRRPALAYAPMARWKQERAHRISAAQYALELDWHRWAETNAPEHVDFTYRKPIDRRLAPVPRFTHENV